MLSRENIVSLGGEYGESKAVHNMLEMPKCWTMGRFWGEKEPITSLMQSCKIRGIEALFWNFHYASRFQYWNYKKSINFPSLDKVAWQGYMKRVSCLEKLVFAWNTRKKLWCYVDWLDGGTQNCSRTVAELDTKLQRNRKKLKLLEWQKFISNQKFCLIELSGQFLLRGI